MITVQPARVEEVQEIKQVLSETWIDTYRTFMPIEVIEKVTALWHKPETLAAMIENENVFFAIAKDEHNAILGLVTAGRRSDENVSIGRLYVRPAHQRRGIGGKLLDACIAAFPGAQRLQLEVEAQNEKGLAFYRKVGFEEIARKEDAIEDITLMSIEMEMRFPGLERQQST
jgi:ribosomal protein S18 acetylase RimI-like enzyme